MITIENVEVVGWEHAIRGMRNPMNSWSKSDSCTQGSVFCNEFCNDIFPAEPDYKCGFDTGLRLGPNDLELMMKLAKRGPVHAKYRRMIVVYLDITAPLCWWKEFDTYKVGTVANSCSTMHKIHEKEFTLDDFSHDHLTDHGAVYTDSKIPSKYIFCDNVVSATQGFNTSSLGALQIIIEVLNFYREEYINHAEESNKKIYWWQMIQLLPSSYNQKRTIMLNYEVLSNLYKSRRNHKLDEWHTLCDWVETLPYSELITGKGVDI